MFKIEFETLNAGVQSPEQVSRIIKHVSQKVANHETEGKIRDNNGNTIGQWSWMQKVKDLTESENFRSSLLAIHLSNDYNFYSSLQKWFRACAMAMLNGEYDDNEERAYLLQEIVKACMSPLIKKHVGPTSAREKAYCAEILFDKYKEEIQSICDDMAAETNA